MFEFEPGLMIWTSVSFAILVYLMYRVALPPLIRILKERESLIAQSLSAASESQKRAEELILSSNKRLAEAGLVAKKIVEEAKAEGEKLKGEILASSKKQSDLFLVKAKEDLRREKDEMLKEIKAKTADLIVEASSRVLERSVTKSDNERIIEESLAGWQ